MDDFYVVIGHRIKQKRIDLHMTRDKLALTAGISDKFLYDIELGRKGMSAQTLYKLACALEVSANWLYEGKEHFRYHNEKVCRVAVEKSKKI
jgi:transcriptional regulator with XRE-family HTH domain